MSRYLQKKFALGRQGGKNLTRAIFACALTNIGLMLPVGLLFLFTQRLFGPLVGLGTPQMGLGGYVGTVSCFWPSSLGLSIFSTSQRLYPPMQRARI